MRRGGWGAAIALVLLATLISAIHPALLIAVPLAMLLVALPPLRSPYRIVGLVLLALLFASPATGPLWYAERGWALMLGAAFLLMVALWPRHGFLHRGLAAVAATAGLSGGILLASHGWRPVELALARRFREAASFWTTRLESAGTSSGGEMAETFRRVAELEVLLYPAMLALASVAALAVAWWAYRRLVEGAGDALAPLREFRFEDHLVWLFIAGAVLLLVPTGDAALRTGANLTAFMGGLYVLRGAAIVLALSGAGALGTVLMALAALLLLPLVASAVLVMGLSDTWLDLRRRKSPDGRPSS